MYPVQVVVFAVLALLLGVLLLSLALWLLGGPDLSSGVHARYFNGLSYLVS
jgi:hypothetical protein